MGYAFEKIILRNPSNPALQPPNIPAALAKSGRTQAHPNMT